MKIALLQAIEAMKAGSSPELLEVAVKAQHFVFDPAPQADCPCCHALVDTDRNTHHGFSDVQLDLPFQICSFEVLGRELGLGTPDFTLKYLIAEEVAPQVVHFYLWVSTTKPGRLKDFFMTVKPEEGSVWNYANALTQNLLKRLKTEQHGYSPVKDRVKWKSKSGTKHKAKIKNIVYVRPKKSVHHQETSETLHRQIIWSHAFWVMGHWRKVSSIGKDRDGKYGMVGITWVVPHVKNADLGDPVLKIHKVG